MSNPVKVHWKAMIWIFCYLQGITNMSMVFGKSFDISSSVVIYVDCDYAGDQNKRRSLTCYLFKLHGWKFTLQSIIVLSTTEIEFTKEVIYLRCLIGNLGV